MRAIVDGHVVAESAETVALGGYDYFPPETVRREWLEPAPKTESDRACPHGVRFYDVVVDGVRHPRAAWCYEAPKPALAAIGGRFGFWEDVTVG
ncbi:MAG: DUF427 domain-containing protein [Rhodospirillales bacterium]|nr:DUF427 domain-containing protein [Rhodospirillales bacterium]